MLKLLQSLFARCPHVWEQYGTADIVRGRGDREAIIGKASFCRCEKCGERRVFKMVVG